MKRRHIPVLFALMLAQQGSTAMAQETANAPRPGKYRVLTYGAPSRPPIFLGYFVLAGGSYKAYLPGDKLSGTGRYTYDPANHTVTWATGPYAGVWGGDFTVERAGKTHQIRLKRNTVATNSSDSP